MGYKLYYIFRKCKPKWSLVRKKTCGEVIIDCDEYGTGACRAPYVSRATTNCAKTCAFCDLNIVGFFLTNNSLRRKKKGFWNQHVVNREFVYPISNKLLPFHVDTHFVLALLKRLNLYKPVYCCSQWPNFKITERQCF